VCKLHKTIYGLKQSPRAWNRRLHEELRKASFTRAEADHSVYIKKDALGEAYLLVYVDDLIIIASNNTALQSCKGMLQKAFLMTDLEGGHSFLGDASQQEQRGKGILRAPRRLHSEGAGEVRHAILYTPSHATSSRLQTTYSLW